MKITFPDVGPRRRVYKLIHDPKSSFHLTKGDWNLPLVEITNPNFQLYNSDLVLDYFFHTQPYKSECFYLYGETYKNTISSHANRLRYTRQIITANHFVDWDDSLFPVMSKFISEMPGRITQFKLYHLPPILQDFVENLEML